MINKHLYTEDSIQSLDPRAFTRLRPGVYCGSTEYSTQLLIEIISNAIDEFKAGHGNLIEVKIDTKENSYMVRDYAQGFLVNSIRDNLDSFENASLNRYTQEKLNFSSNIISFFLYLLTILYI